MKNKNIIGLINKISWDLSRYGITLLNESENEALFELDGIGKWNPKIFIKFPDDTQARFEVMARIPLLDTEKLGGYFSNYAGWKEHLKDIKPLLKIYIELNKPDADITFYKKMPIIHKKYYQTYVFNADKLDFDKYHPLFFKTRAECENFLNNQFGE